MNYRETIDYLFTRLPMFSRIGPSAFKKDLTNTLILCEFLGNPQKRFKSIHVAGTNGKGSVSHMLASVLQSAGYKTGLYTSPHLYDFRERIKINGQLCDEEYVICFTEKIRPVIEKINPSFFEITVAMAFDYFARQETEIAVIEVGLGGRLDSTNVISPELSVITNIGWDHMDMLGNSLEEIAFEKAGIIKPGIPVVVGEFLPETKPVFESKAKEISAELVFSSDLFQVTQWQKENRELVAVVEDKSTQEQKKYQLDLTGMYQLKNLLTVISAFKLLEKKGIRIENSIIQKGLKEVKQNTGLHGRWELIHQNPDVILDVAHNKDGIRQLVQQMELTDYKDYHIILGMVKDKDLDSILPLFPVSARYYFTQAGIPRALPARELKQKAGIYNLYGEIFDHVNDALNHALSKASGQDLILVCGSIFLVAEVNISQLQQAFEKN